MDQHSWQLIPVNNEQFCAFKLTSITEMQGYGITFGYIG
jgi:hypothetical protein